MSTIVYQDDDYEGISSGPELSWNSGVQYDEFGQVSTYNSADEPPVNRELAENRIASYTYPISSGANHYIRFNINLNEESRLIKQDLVATDGYVDYTDQNRAFRNNTTQEIFDVAGKAIGTVGGAVGGTMAATALAGKAVKILFNRKLNGGVVGYGAAIAGAAGGAVGGFLAGEKVAELTTEYLKLTAKLKRLASSITLYTPGNIRAQYNMSYDMPEDLIVNLAQSDNFEAIKAGLASVGSPITGLADGREGFVDDAKSAGNTLGRFGRILASTNQTVSMLSRTAVNNKRDVMFKHVGNRTFNFNYTFAPKSAAEAEIVNNIIFMFKYFAHPEMLPGYGNFLYLYPAEFDIEYGMIVGNPNRDIKQQQKNPYLNKISSCVLTDIAVDYSAGAAFQSLEDGAPMITHLSLTFREIETLHRERIAQGY